MRRSVARHRRGRIQALEEARAPEVAARLEARYGTYSDESSEPVLDQLIWFMLSTRTTGEGCAAAYAALCTRFPSWEALETTSIEEIAPLLRPAGLMRARATALVGALGAIRRRFGEAGLEALRAKNDAECEAFLLSLPGVGLKVARCVLSFGLARPAFAVDAHIWRITRRLGWHSLPGSSPTRPGADLIQAIALRVRDPLSLHVNFIRLGRELCPAGTVRCQPCPLADRCPAARRSAATKASGSSPPD